MNNWFLFLSSLVSALIGGVLALVGQFTVSRSQLKRDDRKAEYERQQKEQDYEREYLIKQFKTIAEIINFDIGNQVINYEVNLSEIDKENFIKVMNMTFINFFYIPNKLIPQIIKVYKDYFMYLKHIELGLYEDDGDFDQEEYAREKIIGQYEDIIEALTNIIEKKS